MGFKERLYLYAVLFLLISVPVAHSQIKPAPFPVDQSAAPALVLLTDLEAAKITKALKLEHLEAYSDIATLPFFRQWVEAFGSDRGRRALITEWQGGVQGRQADTALAFSLPAGRLKENQAYLIEGQAEGQRDRQSGEAAVVFLRQMVGWAAAVKAATGEMPHIDLVGTPRVSSSTASATGGTTAEPRVMVRGFRIALPDDVAPRATAGTRPPRRGLLVVAEEHLQQFYRDDTKPGLAAIHYVMRRHRPFGFITYNRDLDLRYNPGFVELHRKDRSKTLALLAANVQRNGLSSLEKPFALSFAFLARWQDVVLSGNTDLRHVDRGAVPSHFVLEEATADGVVQTVDRILGWHNTFDRGGSIAAQVQAVATALLVKAPADGDYARQINVGRGNSDLAKIMQLQGAGSGDYLMHLPAMRVVGVRLQLLTPKQAEQVAKVLPDFSDRR